MNRNCDLEDIFVRCLHAIKFIRERILPIYVPLSCLRLRQIGQVANVRKCCGQLGGFYRSLECLLDIKL